MEGKGFSAARIAEMQRQIRYEQKRPRYYARLAEKYAMTSDAALMHERNVNWVVGWLLFGAILLFIIVGLGYAFSHSEFWLIGMVLIAAASLSIIVDVLLMEPADEMRRRALVKWKTMMVNVD